MILIFLTKSQFHLELQDPHYNMIGINIDTAKLMIVGTTLHDGLTLNTAVRNVSKSSCYRSMNAYIMGHSLAKCSLQTGLVLTTFCFHFAWHFIWHILARHAPQICARKTTKSSTLIQITQWRVILEHEKHFETVLDKMRYGSLWRTHRIICAAWRSSDGSPSRTNTEQGSCQTQAYRTEVHPTGDTKWSKQEGSKTVKDWGKNISYFALKACQLVEIFGKNLACSVSWRYHRALKM